MKWPIQRGPTLRSHHVKVDVYYGAIYSNEYTYAAYAHLIIFPDNFFHLDWSLRCIGSESSLCQPPWPVMMSGPQGLKGDHFMGQVRFPAAFDWNSVKWGGCGAGRWLWRHLSDLSQNVQSTWTLSASLLNSAETANFQFNMDPAKKKSRSGSESNQKHEVFLGVDRSGLGSVQWISSFHSTFAWSSTVQHVQVFIWGKHRSCAISALVQCSRMPRKLGSWKSNWSSPNGVTPGYFRIQALKLAATRWTLHKRGFQVSMLKKLPPCTWDLSKSSFFSFFGCFTLSILEPKPPVTWTLGQMRGSKITWPFLHSVQCYGGNVCWANAVCHILSTKAHKK